MSNNFSCLFRCDASDYIGGGHVMRCLTLADELTSRGIECIFSCTSETLDFIPLLKSKNYKTIEAEPPSEHYDFMIVDHYELDASFEISCRKQVKTIMVIDDLADRKHDCDLLLDQTFGKNPSDYELLVPSSSKILTGSDYAMLRPQFSEQRPRALERRMAKNGKVERLLVMLGAGDKNNVTGLVLDSLELLSDPLQVDIIMGANAPHLEIIKKQTATSRHNITVHAGVDDVASLMAKADLAIGAGGTASWERCCVGLPTLVIEIADNQKQIIKQLSSYGAVINAGHYQELNASSLKNQIETILSNPSQIQKTANKAAEICDGKGVERICDIIEETLKAA